MGITVNGEFPKAPSDFKAEFLPSLTEVKLRRITVSTSITQSLSLIWDENWKPIADVFI